MLRYGSFLHEFDLKLLQAFSDSANWRDLCCSRIKGGAFSKGVIAKVAWQLRFQPIRSKETTVEIGNLL
jgi:hypothetical protein